MSRVYTEDIYFDTNEKSFHGILLLNHMQNTNNSTKTLE